MWIGKNFSDMDQELKNQYPLASGSYARKPSASRNKRWALCSELFYRGTVIRNNVHRSRLAEDFEGTKQRPVARFMQVYDVKSHNANRKSFSHRRRSAAQAIRVNLVERGNYFWLCCRNITAPALWVRVPKLLQVNASKKEQCIKTRADDCMTYTNTGVARIFSREGQQWICPGGGQKDFFQGGNSG